MCLFNNETFDWIIFFFPAAENICVTEDLKIKITDFGSAKVGDQEQDYQGWTSEYMAPEMCRAFLKSRYPSVFKNETEDFSLTGKVDVFAFGLVLQFMLEKTHTQMKFYTNGASSYTNVEDVNKLRLNIIIAVRYLLINAISFFLISFYVFLNCFILIFNEQRLKILSFFSSLFICSPSALFWF